MNVRRRSLTTTLALLALGLGFAVMEGWQRPRPGPAPVRRHSEAPPRPAHPPSAGDVLARAIALDLTAEQRGQLGALQAQWTAESAAPERELSAASAEFAGFMNEAQHGRGTTLQELQRRTAEVATLSAGLMERRRRHAEAAIAVLDARQRAALAAMTTSPDEPGRNR
jgi:hypothetical protein